MMKKLHATALAFGLTLVSTTTMAFMHDMMGMGGPEMYNLAIGGLANRDDAKGIDDKFRQLNDVTKVHVDFKRGMVMIWVKKGKPLDEASVRRIVKEASFTLDAFENPK